MISPELTFLSVQKASLKRFWERILDLPYDSSASVNTGAKISLGVLIYLCQQHGLKVFQS